MDHLTRPTLIRTAIIVSLALLGIYYLWVLSLTRAPRVDESYRLFFLEGALSTWPDGNALAYRVGETVSFAEPGDPRIGRGFERRPNQGRWTNGREATIVLKPLVTTSTPHRVEINIARVFLSERHERQRVTLGIDGVTLGTWSLSDATGETISAPLPAGALTPGQPALLTLSLPDAHSPRSVGRGNDARPLALFVSSVTIQRVDPGARPD